MDKVKNDLALDLWTKLSKAYDKVRKEQMKQMAQEKLTAPQFSVLEVLSRRGPIPLKRISEELMVTGANITCVVDNLEKEDLVKRVHSKEDRRVINAELTDKGKNKINSILPAYASQMASLTSVLNESEQKELTNLLSKLN
ncbi:MAG: MarR family winged helix-turn-helix transcriptional regulator [Melioribacteraceae bacterium]|nr:MarR family winged helix-turn-helix transcriptional regulator [Melioribacteraceae bacterium]